jgi:hypothetical protein
LRIVLKTVCSLSFREWYRENLAGARVNPE